MSSRLAWWMRGGAWALTLQLTMACGQVPDRADAATELASVAEASSKKKKSSKRKVDRRRQPEGSARMEVSGGWDGTFPEIDFGSSLRPEPYQETLALRLALRGGPDEHPRAFIDLDDLPKPLRGDTYPLGRDGQVKGSITLRPPKLEDSGSRFTVRTGRLMLNVSSGEVSGSIELEAEEKTWDRDQRRTIEIRAQFSELPYRADR